MLALLLGQTKQRYSLPTLIAQAKIRPRQFRQIRPTNALASNMAAQHFAIVRAWQAALPDILAAVPLGRAAVAAAIERAASRIPVAQAKAQFPRAVDAVEQYHRRMWVQRVRSSTGLDVSMFTQPADVADPVAATTSWNGQLADDLHAQTKSRLTAALLIGGIAAADAKARANEVIARARKRAAAVGVDQTRKLVDGMNRDRRIAAGVDKYMWLHSAHVVHPRPHHVARNGRVFGNDEIAPDDRAGVPFGCQCGEIPVFQ